MSETISGLRVLEPTGSAGAFIFTDDEVARLGDGAKVFPVVVTVDGHRLPLRIARMGGVNCVGVRRDLRDAAGLEIGETYAIEIQRDDSERITEIPEDLGAALDGRRGAAVAFAALAPSHRRRYVGWIEDAKRAPTRARRIAETVERVCAALDDAPGTG